MHTCGSTAVAGNTTKNPLIEYHLEEIVCVVPDSSSFIEKREPSSMIVVIKCDDGNLNEIL